MDKDERIEEIKVLANELRKLAYRAGGQCIVTQQVKTLKSNLGKKCLDAIKEYEKEIKEIFGDLDE